MTDVKDAPHLRFGLGAVEEIRVFPWDDVTGGRVEAAFAHSSPLRAGYAGVLQKRWVAIMWGAKAVASAPPRLFGRARVQSKPSSARWNRPACDFSALARVSNQSAISSKPSSRAVRAMPGYMSVYSWVSPAIAARRLLAVPPIGLPVAGSPVSSRYSRWPWAWPVSPSAVERNTADTSL